METTLNSKQRFLKIIGKFRLEEYGGTNFLVLELVEGNTLADRIAAGPIPAVYRGSRKVYLHDS
jgi:hypothetical protein